MSAGPPRHILATIPLGKDTVLLPGVSLKIPIGNRTDIPALLSHIYSSASTPKGDPTSISVGCVPLCSPLLSHEGQKLLEDSEFRTRKIAESLVDNPNGAQEKDLFIYGVEAKITGVEGKTRANLAIVVEGFRRFRIERYTQFKPYRECEVTDLPDVAPDPGDSEVQALFQKLKDLSKELLKLVRLSSLLPRASATLSVVTARRLDLFIAKKEFHEWGVLCDFMATVAPATYEERLQVLSALEPKVRLERVIELLRRQIDGMKGNIKITSITRTELPAGGIDITNLPPSQRDALIKRSGMFPGSLPAGFGMPGRRGGDDDDEGPNEIEELKKKLDEAGLSAEAQKVADKELRRLKKMNPAQADYNVCRTYLENLAEIPWTKTTEDHLGADTLKRARRQLDEDHYGLEKVKKRLLEYLAVLKLKQAINQDLENEIGKAAEEEKALEEKRQSDKEAAKKQAKLLEGSKEEKDDASSKEVKSKDKSATKAPRPESAKLQILRSKRQVDKSPILLLVGPPGVGKTSLAKSMATALGRQFHRISLGGVRDEAEIRGHRRTYVAAMPGVIVQGLKKVGVSNPVFLLDEIDKVGGSNFHGDPSAAMLEVLDPEQNNTFTDHYVNIPIDLSKVLFIATANTLDTIPAPLLDRMETINLSGYTTIEKRHIANRHLIPKQIRTNGMAEKQVVIPEKVLDTIITEYTRESGVRNLEREIGSVCRYKAVQYSDAKDSTSSKEESTSPSPNNYKPEVSMEELDTILGHSRYDLEIADTEASVPGIVTGLVAFSYGGMGSILFIEVADIPGGSGKVQLTGTLGDVLKESVEVALSWVRSHSYDLGLTDDNREDIMSDRSIHVHCPAGAVPKDGPSAGVAHTIALISLFSGRPVSPQIAMTGEISLRGLVLPVGGIKEKLIGAHRAGVKTVLLPKKNEKDIDDLPEEVKKGIKIVPIRHVWEAVRLIWPNEHWPRQTGFEDLQSRL